MGAALAIAKAEVRARWRPLVALAVLVGLGVGATLSLVAGARRSSTVVERFREAHQVADLVVQPDQIDPERLAALRADPAVEAAAPLAVVFARVKGSDTDIINESQTRAAVDGTYGVDLDRPAILAGEPLDHDDPSAVEISESVAAEHGLAPGDHVVLETLTVPQIVEGIFEGTPIGAPEGPELDLVVQAVVRPPNEILGLTDAGAILLPRALWEQVGEAVPLDPSTADPGRMGGFDNVLPTTAVPGQTAGAIAAARRIFASDDELFVEESAQEAAGIEDLAAVASAALLIAAVVAGIATAVIGAQAVARHTDASAADRSALDAIGLGRSSRTVASALPLGVALLGVAVTAPLVAVAASRWFPTGELRRIEPDAGLHVDVVVVAFGATASVLLVGAFALVSSWRAHTRSARSHRTRLSRFLSRGPVVPATALRLATSRGVPVRPAFGGAVAALVGVAAAATFGASLDRFVDDPARDGWTWDAEVGMGDELDDPAAIDLAGHLADNAVVDGVLLARVGTLGTGEQEDDVQVFGLHPVSGDVSLLVLDGALPEGDDEVAIGADTAARYDADVGDVVEVEGFTGPRSLGVSGIVRFPIVGSDNAADGMALTLDGLALLAPPSLEDGAFGFPTAFVDWAAGVTTAEGEAALGDEFAIVYEWVPSSDVSSLDKVGGMVPMIAALLTVLGVFAVAHALTVAVRRQRRSVGVLRAIGFVRSQVWATVSAQALAYGLLGVLLGVPLGIVVGRWSWRWLAQSLGAADDPLTPAALVLAVPATLILVAVVTVLPARAAARTRPSVALRSE